MFIKEVSSALSKAALFDQKYCNNGKLWNIITIWNSSFLCEYVVQCNLISVIKSVFSASLLQQS